MSLYLCHGSLRKPGSRYISHYCGLPVRASSHEGAKRRVLAVLGTEGTVAGIRETTRMPILDYADEYLVSISMRLTARDA